MDAHDDEYRTESRKHEYEASLRVISEALRLADIVAALGPPSECRDIGEAVSRRPGAAKSKHAFWSLRADVEKTKPLSLSR